MSFDGGPQSHGEKTNMFSWTLHAVETALKELGHDISLRFLRRTKMSSN